MRYILTTLLVILTSYLLLSQCPFQIKPRLSFYTTETSVEFLVLAETACNESQQVAIFYNGNKYFDQLIDKTRANDLYSFVIPEPLHDTIMLTIAYGGSLYFDRFINIPRFPGKNNAVKIDYKTNSLLVNDLPFIPVGFYCYSPVAPTMSEEEVVRGFNLMSPYQRIEDSTYYLRKAYMDRCAELGMKVHYNLLSVSGGGGVGNGRAILDKATKLRLLENEIALFKDHPALLAWYIADEPDGQGVKPESLTEYYQLIKKLDPYHPVSIVFINPEAAKKYTAVMDIVMADPYPIPNGNVLEAEKAIRNLYETFLYRQQVWVVPQAFGGGEFWQREPSRQELRAMTWLSVLAGARGVQYFVRNGLNGFPKSVAAWNECGEIAMEIADLTPFLTSGLIGPSTTVTDPAVRVKTYRDSQGNIALVAVNSGNNPTVCSVRFEPFRKNGFIVYPFENNTLVNDMGYSLRQRPGSTQPDTLIEEITLLLDGFDSKVILFENGYPQQQQLLPGNLIVDPGFERRENPGVPSACYLRTGKDRGATAFTDTRTYREGRASLRINTPREEAGLQVSLFPARVNANTAYQLSFWAKTDSLPKRLRVGFGTVWQQEITISGDWKWYEVICTPPVSGDNRSSSFHITLVSPGTAWIDLFQVAETPLVYYSNDIFKTNTQVRIDNRIAGTEILLSVNDSLPNKYVTPLELSKGSKLTIITQKDGLEIGRMVKDIFVNCQQPVSVATSAALSAKYNGGGHGGLYDGILGKSYNDGCWQGYTAKEWNVVVDMGTEGRYSEAVIHFLQDPQHWIYAPSEVAFSISTDGQKYRRVKSISFEQHKYSALSNIIPFKATIDQPFRYLKIYAKNIGNNPPDHPSAGGNTWIFADEIMVTK